MQHIILARYVSDSDEFISFNDSIRPERFLSVRLSTATGTNSCVPIYTPLGKEEENVKVQFLYMKHISTDELERKLKEKEVELIRLLDEEEYLRSEQKELLNKIEQ